MALLLAVPASTAAQTWSVRIPTAVRETGRFSDPQLRESSAAARGVRNAGVFWTVNDSGNPAALFAVDTTGVVRAVFAVTGPLNTDWEALATGPCGTATCLYIGDVGDNYSRRGSIAIYRVEEPRLDSPRSTDALPLYDSLTVSLEGGPRDIEAMVVTPGGDVALISKGWHTAPSVHQIPASAWAHGTIEARLVGSLPIATGLLRGRLITDAALSSDGSRLAVRSYREIFLFRRSGHSGLLPDQPEMACDVGGREPLGEGITWWNDSTLLLTSERALLREGTVLMVRCDP